MDVLKSCLRPRDTTGESDENQHGSLFSCVIDSIDDGSMHIGVWLLLQAMLFIPVEAKSYKCIFVQCEQTYPHPISMIRHLLECRVFSKGGTYYCYRCKQQHILERAIDAMRSDTQHELRKVANNEESIEAPQCQKSTLGIICNPCNPNEVPREQELRAIPKGRISQIKEEEWEKRKKEIHRLYITEGASLSTVMRIMEKIGFHATYVISIVWQ